MNTEAFLGTLYPEMPQITVTPKGVKKLLMDLQSNKASGPDQLPARILKECAEELAPILAAIFNQSLNTGELLTGLCPILPLFLKRVIKSCPVITDQLPWRQFAAKYWSTFSQATLWLTWTIIISSSQWCHNHCPDLETPIFCEYYTRPKLKILLKF